MDDERRLAVLIDADNVSYKHVKYMFNEIANYGTPTYKRIYGDWTQTTMTGWKAVLLESGLTPIQQYSYTSGKNSTDSALIIDAMDILYSGRVDGFCIVSSDSDFTRLALRLREAGMQVIGIGEKKTPTPFIAACDKFIYLEVLMNTRQAQAGRTAKEEPTAEEAALLEAERIIGGVVDELSDEEGWAFLGQVGSMLNRLHPDFDPRNYGFTKLSQLLQQTGKYELEARHTADRHVRHIYVRRKTAQPPVQEEKKPPARRARRR